MAVKEKNTRKMVKTLQEKGKLSHDEFVDLQKQQQNRYGSNMTSEILGDNFKNCKIVGTNKDGEEVEIEVPEVHIKNIKGALVYYLRQGGYMRAPQQKRAQYLKNILDVLGVLSPEHNNVQLNDLL